MKIFKRLLYRLYLTGIHRIRCSRWVCFLLFGFRPKVRSSECGDYWDWTTIELKKVIDRANWKSGIRLLDMGTGAVAILSIYAQKRYPGIVVDAVDHDQDTIQFAKREIVEAGSNIDCYFSELFEQVTGCFDSILFNAPYIDLQSDFQADVLIDSKAMLRFSGGEGGGKTVERFLELSPQHLLPEGSVHLGVNGYHIKSELVESMIGTSVFSIDSISRSGWNGAIVYTLKLRSEGNHDPL